MIQTFRDMDVDFIDAVKKRRNQLLEMMRNRTQPSDVYTVIGGRSKKKQYTQTEKTPIGYSVFLPGKSTIPYLKKVKETIALFQEINAPWELFAWLVMIQMQRLDDKKHPLFLLNLKCSNSDNITERLQKYVSCLMLQTKLPQPENIQIVTQGPSTVMYNNGMQRIFLAVCQTKNTYRDYVEFTERFHHDHLPKQIPILLGNQFVIERVVWNLDVNEETFNSASIASDENLSQLRQLVVYQLESIIFQGHSSYNKFVTDPDDPEEAWDLTIANGFQLFRAENK